MNNPIEIIKACINGNRKAQKQLYQLYADKMFGVCMRYADNEDEAKDILQDGFIKVFLNLKQFNHKGSFEGWIRRIMVNTALEKFRDKSYLFAVNMDQGYESKDTEYDHILTELAAQDLLKLVQELSPQYRMVFNLYAIEGYSHKEICEMLNIKEGTSKSNLSRAREILKEKVKNHYGVKINYS
ncbi:MAG: sigma-70 family RNA polymerase sigma factor [Bacteroidales bacterium]|nr:sigma-70 family RNA polymerase sigma factor [Bacteroidales bacterium]